MSTQLPCKTLTRCLIRCESARCGEDIRVRAAPAVHSGRLSRDASDTQWGFGADHLPLGEFHRAAMPLHITALFVFDPSWSDEVAHARRMPPWHSQALPTMYPSYTTLTSKSSRAMRVAVRTPGPSGAKWWITRGVGRARGGGGGLGRAGACAGPCTGTPTHSLHTPPAGAAPSSRAAPHARGGVAGVRALAL